MKLHTVATAVFAATFMLLESGCFFTAMNKMAGGERSTGARLAAGTADVATLPLQAPAVLLGVVTGNVGIDHARYDAQYTAALAAIKKDATVVLGWDLSATVHEGNLSPEMSAVWEALLIQTPGFTDALLREIARRSPMLRPMVFRHSSASAAFIRESFDAAMAEAARSQTQTIENMVVNPAMPDDLLLAVIQRLPGLREAVFSKHTVPESFIRAVFEEEMLKEAQAQPGASNLALRAMIRNPSMPDALMFEVNRRLPNLSAIVFSAASESFLRATFEEELLKESQSQPPIRNSTPLPGAALRQSSAIRSMIRNPHMPDDLLLRISEAKLPNGIDGANARQELKKRAAAKRPTQTPASDTPPATP